MPAIDRTPPPYMQVVADLRAKIESGELRPGELLPSDRDLAAEWKISRATAQKALAALRAEGIVEAQVGVGTRVSAHNERRHFSGLDRAVSTRRTGRIYNQGEYARIVSAGIVAAPDYVAEVLGIEPGAPAIQRVRVTYGPDDKPTSASTSWFDGALADRAPKLLETERIIEGTWGYIESQTGRNAVAGQDRIRARMATKKDAELLSLTLPAAVKVTRTILRDADRVALELGISITEDRESIYDYDVARRP
jgi:DNA-binding GntR family transcriptional regulator